MRRSANEARSVLDYRVVVETGATVLAVERAGEDVSTACTGSPRT